MKRNILKILLAFIIAMIGVSGFVSNVAPAKNSGELTKIKKLAKEGKTIPTKSLKLGDSGNKVKPVLGKPDDIAPYYSSVDVWYKNKNKAEIRLFLNNPTNPFPKIALVKDNKIDVISASFINKKEYTYSEINKVFGKPYRSGPDNKYLEYDIWYKVGKYNVVFSTQNLSKLSKNKKFKMYSVNRIN